MILVFLFVGFVFLVFNFIIGFSFSIGGLVIKVGD